MNDGLSFVQRIGDICGHSTTTSMRVVVSESPFPTIVVGTAPDVESETASRLGQNQYVNDPQFEGFWVRRQAEEKG